MSVKDNFQLLPKISDSYGWLYVEHAIIDRENNAIAILNREGRTLAPCATICFLMIGPGVSITHAAVNVLAEHGCSIGWTGEHGVRLYASGTGETHSAKRLLHQAQLWSDLRKRMQVVRNLYQARFSEPLSPNLTLRQIRGMEGKRVREAYARASAQSGVPWQGRSYKMDEWDHADPINRALSSANACLYGVCHAAIVSAGYSPAIGFIHTGTLLAFVYDVADLYKTEISIPLAFQIVAESSLDVERRTRRACRDYFQSKRILGRIVSDIHRVLMVPESLQAEWAGESERAPLTLWDPVEGELPSGRDYSGNASPNDWNHQKQEEPSHGGHDFGTGAS
ncbi:MAG: type I-E CRISPR-associated endonuclease Cas1e [Candidatus Sumerlaeaceae bacterium]|nr:type I-E CRISPR-associated endonuclease Cas1e [Candidatus Sumerlaeaceae bacterium]